MATDSVTFRVNAADNPEHAKLHERFSALQKRFGFERSQILRELIWGYCECVDRLDTVPELPLTVDTLASRKGAKK